MKVDFLIGDNRYGSAAHFSKMLAAAFERQGVYTRLHWIAEGRFSDALHTIQSDPPDLTCSFSDIKPPLGLFWPHLSLLVDPAIYFLHQLQGEQAWVSCVDEGDVEFLRSLDCERAFYLPHGVESTLKTSPAKKRPYDVVFFGSCIEPEAPDEIVLAASQRVLSSENLSILQSLVELEIADEKLPGYHMQVDLYTRFLDRVSLLKSLKSHRVHIWGEGAWEKYVPHATVHPAIPFEKTFEVMQAAKIVVNSSPRFKRGLHERILYGAMCGAAVLSASEIGYTYCYGEWENQTFKDWEQKADQLQSHVLAHHTWDHRAKTLLTHFC
ncbi:MAG: hypothetical protein S4CHLAM2_17580 [Chlamydiales bacterium]|nr:hypothetical protein [Chlamydiales bacterium]